MRLRALEDRVMDWLATLLRRGTRPLLVLLPLWGCCWLSGIAGQLIPGLRSVYVNHLDRVEGVGELVAPSQWRPIIYGMAPDGGHILMSWQQRVVREWLIFDTATQQTTPLALTEIVTAIWLDDRYVVVYGKFPGM